MLTRLATVFVALLAALCLSDIAQAAMPADAVADCPTRLCDGQLGCGLPGPAQALFPSSTFPAIIVASPRAVAELSPAGDSLASAPLDVGSSRPVAPLPARSPPLAA